MLRRGDGRGGEDDPRPGRGRTPSAGGTRWWSCRRWRPAGTSGWRTPGRRGAPARSRGRCSAHTVAGACLRNREFGPCCTGTTVDADSSPPSAACVVLPSIDTGQRPSLADQSNVNDAAGGTPRTMSRAPAEWRGAETNPISWALLAPVPGRAAASWRVQVRRGPAAVADVAANRAFVQVDDPGPPDHRQQLRLGPGIGNCGPFELSEPLQVIFPGAANRADDRGDMPGNAASSRLRPPSTGMT